MDDDTMSDDCLGEREIDLTKQYFSESFDGSVWIQSLMLDLLKDGEVQGSVKLAFCKIPHVGARPGEHEKARLQPVPVTQAGNSFKGEMHVKVFRVEGFPDKAGFMDKTDPKVRYSAFEPSSRTRMLGGCRKSPACAT